MISAWLSTFVFDHVVDVPVAQDLQGRWRNGGCRWRRWWFGGRRSGARVAAQSSAIRVSPEHGDQLIAMAQLGYRHATRVYS